MKRIFSVFLTLAILLSMFGGIAETVSAVELPAEMLPAYEEEEYPTQGTCGPNLKWEYLANANTLRIYGTGPMTDYGIEIWYQSVDPDVEEAIRSSLHSDTEEKTQMYTTGEMAPWYEFRYIINHVIIESGVTSIGDGAFEGCKGLTSIEIPNSVTSIGAGAFKSSKLTSVTIPDSITEIPSALFQNCRQLQTVTLSENVITILKVEILDDGNYRYLSLLFPERDPSPAEPEKVYL